MPTRVLQGAMKRDDDPLDDALRPPDDETPLQRDLRLAREEEARKVSQQIDADIKAERLARKKKRIVRLLLLGQSESGKSTTLRQFQRLYTPTAFREERILWRAVIQLNIVRSIRLILDALQSAASSPQQSPRSHVRSLSNPLQHQNSFHNSHGMHTSDPYNTSYNAFNNSPPHVHYQENSRPIAGPSQRRVSSPSPPPLAFEQDYFDDDSRQSGSDSGLSEPLEALQARLLPLFHIEQLLIARLVPPDEDEPTRLQPPSPRQVSLNHHYPRAGYYQDQEVFVRSGLRWKGALAKSRRKSHASASSGEATDDAEEGIDEAQQVLYECREDMMRLWEDPGVKDILWRKKIRLEELPGFYLNDLERVTSLRYTPNDDDVLKARLKTVGVSEYKFEMEVLAGKEQGTEWRIIDVGGSRSQRQTWIPFFDDVDAIIFLAPISGFDQVLAENRNVNRLEDSVLLWKSICQNKLLQHVDLVLFLNKCDIMETKLNAGIKLARYIRSYGDRENDIETASQYLRSKFSAIHREYSPNPRKFYAFCTSVTDSATTAGIIASVRDMVLRQHLKQSKLL